ncbi:hypothetical protein [Pseudoroseicyclus aestuarii]|uniref:hypothetical protein n=1 Tax=Pseudoroseicyclus aestuarii TaxID=1795041 RepID=UPI0011B5A337|nr:hypothetical protein [Pseudoroseicyclus aestuarii]
MREAILIAKDDWLMEFLAVRALLVGSAAVAGARDWFHRRLGGDILPAGTCHARLRAETALLTPLTTAIARLAAHEGCFARRSIAQPQITGANGARDSRSGWIYIELRVATGRSS